MNNNAGSCWKTLLTASGRGFFIALLLITVTGGAIMFKNNSNEKTEIKPFVKSELTPAEAAVILNKGTEMPFTGKYNDNYKAGLYVCRQCGAPLYRSDDKFKTGCGWPGFDDELPEAVTRTPDADGRRVEITCSRCGGHLGHVFDGERLTPKNQRHCVNSISMKFIPDTDAAHFGRAVFAGGCFWGVEYHLNKVPGVISTTVGYIGGNTEYPTYEQVCSQRTGHAEAVEVIFDPEELTYEQLAKLFFEIHDPTQKDRQGPDIGDQYRSAVFYYNEEQKKTTEQLIKQLISKGYDVETELVQASRFWPAEEYHRNYYRRKGTLPYCHTYKKRF